VQCHRAKSVVSHFSFLRTFVDGINYLDMLQNWLMLQCSLQHMTTRLYFNKMERLLISARVSTNSSMPNYQLLDWESWSYKQKVDEMDSLLS
jgi:hypothetical protein